MSRFRILRRCAPGTRLMSTGLSLAVGTPAWPSGARLGDERARLAFECLGAAPRRKFSGWLRRAPHQRHRRQPLGAGDRARLQAARPRQAFRAMKSPEIEIRPLHHHLEQRVRAHVFLCMLAYAVRFELEQRLAPLLFKDDNPLAPADPVAPAQRSPAATRKAATKRTDDGLPVSASPTSSTRSPPSAATASASTAPKPASTGSPRRTRSSGAPSSYSTSTPTACRQNQTGHQREIPLPKPDYLPQARKLPPSGP
jgi:hypothetical protein